MSARVATGRGPAAIAAVWLRLQPIKAPQIASKVLELSKPTAKRAAAADTKVVRQRVKDLTEEQLADIRAKIAAGVKVPAIAKEYRLLQDEVKRIAKEPSA